MIIYIFVTQVFSVCPALFLIISALFIPTERKAPEGAIIIIVG